MSQPRYSRTLIMLALIFFSSIVFSQINEGESTIHQANSVSKIPFLQAELKSLIKEQKWQKALEQTLNIYQNYHEQSGLAVNEIRAFLEAYGDSLIKVYKIHLDSLSTQFGHANHYLGHFTVMAFDENSAMPFYLGAAETFYANKVWKSFFEVKGEICLILANERNFKLLDQKLEKAYSLAEKHLGSKKDPSLSRVYLAQSIADFYSGDVQKSLDNNELALGLASNIRDSALILQNKALSFYRKKNYIPAEKHFQETIRLFSERSFFEKNDYLGTCHYYLGGMLTMLRKPEKALFHLNKSLQYYSDNTFVQSFIYTSIGRIYSTLAQYDSALENNLKGIECSKKALGQNNSKLGILLNQRGNIYIKMQDFSNAEIWHQKALDNFISNGRGKDRMIAEIYLSKGIVDWNLKNYDTSLQNLHSALEIYRNSNVEPDYLFYHLAHVHSLNNSLDSSLFYIQKLIQRRAKGFDSDDINSNPSIVQQPRLIELGTALFKKGDLLYQLYEQENGSLNTLELAYQTILAARQCLQKARTSWGIYKSSKQFFYNQDLEIFDDQIKVPWALYQLTGNLEYLKITFDWIESNKFYTLMSQLQKEPLQNIEDELLSKERDLQKTLDALLSKQVNFLEENKEDSLIIVRDQIGALQLKQTELLKKLKEKYPTYYKQKYELVKANPFEIQDELSKDEIWLEFVISSKGSYIFIIDAESFDLVKLPLERKILSGVVKELYRLLQSPFLIRRAERQSFIENSFALYQSLIQPIERHLEGKKKINLVLEDELFYIPFEVLIKSQEELDFKNLPYLLLNFDINYHYSATTFQKLKEKDAILDNSFIGIAPVFEKEVQLAKTKLSSFQQEGIRGVEKGILKELPHTEKEIQSIASLLKSQNGETQVLLKNNAKEGVVKTVFEEKPYQFMHIATHGLADLKYPIQSALILDQNEHSEDGLFHAYEIQQLDIKTDLVVLSSCESGFGKLIGGEGLMGLNRSFFQAGANNVLFSLWKINDEASCELMIKFYKHYLSTKSYGKALRSAKLEFLKSDKWSIPRYWGAFVLIGE